MKKSAFALIMLLVLGLVSFETIGTSKSETDLPEVFVDPSYTSYPLDTTFNVTIAVSNVVNLYGWEFNMTFNPTILNATKAFEGPFLKQAIPDPPGPYKTFFLKKTNNTAGWINIADTVNPLNPPPPSGATGDGILATITFKVKAPEGTSPQHFVKSILNTVVGQSKQPILHTVVDGLFEYPSQNHDIAVTDVAVSPNSVRRGESISINVTVQNQGVVDEAFSLTIFGNTTTINTWEVSLASGATQMLPFIWNTTTFPDGNYTIKAKVPYVGETDRADNTYVYPAIVVVHKRDLALYYENIVAWPSVVTKPNPFFVNVTVTNKGDLPETFNVTVYAEMGTGILQETGTIYDAPGRNENTTITLALDTTFAATGTYTIIAQVQEIAGESDTGNNRRTDGFVQINRLLNAPVASFTFTPRIPLKGQTVSFNATQSYDPDPDGHIVNYEWDFGDETPILDTTDTTVFHAYSTEGTYGATLTVTDDTGLTDSLTKQVRVAIGYPEANFTYSPSIPLMGLTVTFNASTSTPVGGQIIEYNWDFGDNETLTGLTVTHSYALCGNYTAMLNVTDSEGLWDIETKNLTVFTHNVAITDLTVSPKTVEKGQQISISVTVTNAGNYTETFDVTIYYDDTQIDTRSVTNLAPDASQEITILWDTSNAVPGNHTLKATASTVAGEGKTNDNMLVVGSVVILTHDIAITNLTATPNTVKIGQQVTISITLLNKGNFTETFDVTAYHNDTLIDTETVTGLLAGASQTLTILWDTGGINPSVRIVKATASNVAGETETNDNTFIGSTVTIQKQDSQLSIFKSLTTLTVGQTVTINGAISPLRSAIAVKVQYRPVGDQAWDTVTTVTTNEQGQYTCDWKPEKAGIYEVKATWQGDSTTTPSESAIQTITVQEPPTSLWLYMAAASVIIIVAIAATVYFVKIRKRKS